MPTVKGRSTLSTNAALEIDGQSLGWLKSVEPAPIEFVADPATPGQRLLRFGEFQATQAITGPGGVLDWVLPLLESAPAAASGAVVLADTNFQARRRADFKDALITEVRFEDLDATGKQAFAVALKWQPASVAFSKASGVVAAPRLGKRKAWLVSNFRVQGLPFDTRFVTRVQWPVITHSGGDAGARFSEWRIELGAGSADSVLAYADQLMQDGMLTDDELFDCSMELLDTSLSKVLATVSLAGCALLRLAHPAEAAAGAGAGAGPYTLSFSVARLGLRWV
jgi:hypothetical protein